MIKIVYQFYLKFSEKPQFPGKRLNISWTIEGEGMEMSCRERT